MAAKRQQEPPPHPEEHLGVELDQGQFGCSICLDLLKQPVTIPCGHNYCKVCIEGCWDREEAKGEFRCPQCREAFRPRPVLRRNTMVAQVVEKMRSSTMRPPLPAASVACAGPEDVPCDFCRSSRPDKAVMSCLTCLASYCPAHLQPHYSVPVLVGHQLVSATTPLKDRMCRKHNKPMEVYCRTDKQLVCSMCTVEEHKGHKMTPVSVQKAKLEKHLDLNQKAVQRRVEQREKELTALSEAKNHVKSCAKTAREDCDQILGALISSMQSRRAEVARLIGEQERRAVAQAEELEGRLEEDVASLRRSGAHLERLSLIDDPIHLVQIFQDVSTCSSHTPDLSPGPLRSFRDVTGCLAELRDKLETILRDTWPRIPATVSYVDLSPLPTPRTRQEFLQYCCPLTLDVTSNYPYLHLIDKNRRLRPLPSPYGPEPGRFTLFPQVLCSEGLSERHYWELEWNARTLSAAVAYKDIGRTSDESRFGSNDKSWSLECTAEGYLFRHDSVESTVPGSCSYKIGMYLDYKVGTLSYYQVSNPMVLIHEVKTTFTRPLYPGLGLNYQWYDVGVFAQIVKLWE